jgi:hypothetical protein
MVPPSGLQSSPLEIVIAQHHLGPSVFFQAVQGSPASVLVVGHRAGPESPLRIARTVVHPSSGRRDLLEHARRAVRPQVDEGLPGRDQPAVVTLDGCDRTDGPGHRVGAHGDESSLVVDSVAVHASGEDVDT